MLFASVPRRIQQYVNPTEHVDDFRDKLGLLKRLSTRKGDASFIGAQDICLSVQDRSQFLGCILPPRHPLTGRPADDLRFRRESLRVVAPGTSQWTTLQEHRGADAWPIVYGKFLDVEHDARDQIAHLSLSDVRRCDEAWIGESIKLVGLYRENPKKATDRPTAKRLLRAFPNTALTIIQFPDRVVRYATPLTPLQNRILLLLGVGFVTQYLLLADTEFNMAVTDYANGE